MALVHPLRQLEISNTRHREDPWPIDETATAGWSWRKPNIINAVAHPSSLALAGLALTSVAALRRKTHRPALRAAPAPTGAAQHWRRVRPPATAQPFYGDDLLVQLFDERVAHRSSQAKQADAHPSARLAA